MKAMIYFGAARAGGGISILENFLRCARKRSLKDFGISQMYVVVPDNYDTGSSPENQIQLIHSGSSMKGALRSVSDALMVVPGLLRKHKIDVLLNFGDIPIRSSVNQKMVFDWPYAIYPESSVWDSMAFAERAFRNLKLFVFKKLSGNVDTWVPQTDVAKARLERLFSFDSFSIVPNAVNKSTVSEKPLRSEDRPYTFYYLTRYYPHKNLEVLVDVAQAFKKRGLSYRIVVTLDPDEAVVQPFLKKIQDLQLEDVLVNRGSVPYAQLTEFYEQVDCLIMPTLLESYSSAYPEAMMFNKPIVTSDLDFAHAVCGDAAVYVDPFDAGQIEMALEDVAADQSRQEQLIEAGHRRLEQFLDWDEVFELYLDTMVKKVG